MEENSKQIIENPTPVDSPQSIPVKQFGWKIGFFILLFVLVVVIAGSVYLSFKNSSKLTNSVINQSSPSLIPQNTITPELTGNWVTIPKNFMGTYTFQYPAGWHIVNQWPTNETDGITIFLDPNPLNFAPRGGPISALRMTDTSGKPNPDELFIVERNKFKARLTNGKEEVINSDVGPVYHYWGKTDFYAQIIDVEGYFFQIQAGVNDLINKHNIFATSDTSTEYSDILKKMVLSFKKSQ